MLASARAPMLPCPMATAAATAGSWSSAPKSSSSLAASLPSAAVPDVAAQLLAKLSRLTDALGSVPELSVTLAATEHAAMASAARPSSASSSSLSSAERAAMASAARPTSVSSTATATTTATAASDPSTTPSPSDAAFARGVAAMVTAMFQGREGPASFSGRSVPAMGMDAYVDRVVRYLDLWAVQHHGKSAGTGARCALMAVELLNRVCDNGGAVCPRTAHRLFLAATLVSGKQTEDFVLSNRFMSKVGGIPLEEMNRLELDLCALLGWKLVVSRDDVAALRDALAEPAF